MRSSPGVSVKSSAGRRLKLTNFGSKLPPSLWRDVFGRIIAAMYALFPNLWSFPITRMLPGLQNTAEMQ